MSAMRTLLTLLAMALPGASALSCMCVSYDPANDAQLQALVDSSDVVATVIVEDIAKVANAEFEAHLLVEQSLLGNTSGALTLVQNFKGPCVCDPRLMPQRRYLVFVKIDDSGARQSGPIIAFPDAERFLLPLRAVVGAP